MAGLRQCLHDVSIYLIFLVAITTLGPLQFGFHLVRHSLASEAWIEELHTLLLEITR
jgi:hypothetical protein